MPQQRDGPHLEPTGPARAPGLQGPPGVDGEDGAPGEPGPPGAGGIGSVDELAGKPCNAGQPGQGVASVSIDAATHEVTLLCPPSNRHELTVQVSGPGRVTSAPAGIDCWDTPGGENPVGDCAETYDGGTEVSLVATDHAASLFTGWGGACAGQPTTCKVTMDAGKDVTATFDAAAITSTYVSRERTDEYRVVPDYFYGEPSTYYWFPTAGVTINGEECRFEAGWVFAGDLEEGRFRTKLCPQQPKVTANQGVEVVALSLASDQAFSHFEGRCAERENSFGWYCHYYLDPNQASETTVVFRWR